MFESQSTPSHRGRVARLHRAVAFIAAILLGVLAVAPAGAGEPAFVDAIQFGSGSDFMQAVAVGDVDGDGDLDLVIGGKTGRNVVYINDGAGNYQRSFEFGAGKKSVNTLLLADLNGDGYLDVVTGSDGQNYVYLNQRRNRAASLAAMRAPVLYDVGQPFGTMDETTLALAVGDVTGDGHYDIVTANDGQDFIFPGDGAGGFATPVQLGNGADRSTSVVLVDLDRQNGLDVVVGGVGQTLVFFKQEDGLLLPPANLAEVSAAGRVKERYCPLWACREEQRPDRVSVGQVSETYLAAADLNDDTYPDLIVATGDGRLQLFLADTRGSFLQPRELRAASDTLNTSGVVAGDVDGDGRIDIVTAHPFAQNVIYLNAGKGEFRPGMGVGSDFDVTRGVALADVDGDSDVDLIFVNYTQPGVIYRNNGAGELIMAQPFGTGLDRPSDVILVDLNGDGDLDLVMAQDARSAGSNLVYLNSGAGRAAGEPVFLPGQRLGDNKAWTKGVAVGNFDQNPLPDIVLGNYAQPSQILFNVQDCRAGEACGFESRVLDDQKRLVLDVAVGDLDGDEHLDIVLAVQSGRNVVYLNDGAGGFLPAREFGVERLSTQSIALGDVDADGDLDIVAGTANYANGEQDWVYLNDGHANFATRVALDNGVSSTIAVALADFNGDGYLDIAAARRGLDGRNRVYLNNGQGIFDRVDSPRPFGSDLDDIRSLATVDFDGDGDLDIMTDAGVFLNDGRATFDVRRSLDPSAASGRLEHAYPEPVIAGDLNRDGAPDLVVSKRNHQHQVYLNTLRHFDSLAGHSPHVSIFRPAPASSQGAAAANQPGVIPFTLQVSDPGLHASGPVRVCFSLDGGGKWNVALQPGQMFDLKDRVVQPPTGCPFREEPPEKWRASSPAFDAQGRATFEWDMVASGFFGQSQDVVVRVEVYPDHSHSTGGLVNILPYPYVTAASAPFPARGVQVQTLIAGDAVSDLSPAAGALVFRIPAGQQVGGVAMGGGGRAYRTDGQGYLQGRGMIAEGETLAALLPITRTRTITTSYALFHSSAQPVSMTLKATTVSSNTLLHQLVISPENPLLLFDLNVSLEWDARNDPEFLLGLDAAFKRASEVLYDLSNGQMALGRVRVFQNKEQWLTSDVQIYAGNRVRPRASMGGVARQTLDEQDRDGRIIQDAYYPGAIRMGPNWDPYGQSRADLGRDWWRAFAHELGHHLLFLPDNYLGYKTDADGAIVGVTRADCHGSMMTTAYDDAYSEFLDFSDPKYYEQGANGETIVNWPGACRTTLAAYTTKYSDWETIQRKYPMVDKPGETENPGPAALPLELTQVQFVPPLAESGALPARFFDLRDAVTSSRLLMAQGQVYLFKSNGTPLDISDDAVITLGTTGRSDTVKVRGAAEGDRICVFDNSGDVAQIGCAEDVSSLSTSIPISMTVSDWQPNIQVHPIALPALLISVTHSAALAQPTIEVASLSGQVTTTVRQVPELGLASVHYQPGGGAGQGFTVVISGTHTISTTNPRLDAWLYQGASIAITARQPLAPGQPAIVQIDRPGLAITVTQAIAPNARLLTQVLPGYQLGPKPYAPFAVAVPLSAAGDQVFQSQVVLNHPAYAGNVRIWVERAATGGESDAWTRDLREALGRFYLKARRNPDGTYAWGSASVSLVPSWQDKLDLVRQLAVRRLNLIAGAPAETLSSAERLALIDPLGLATDDRGLLGTDDRALLGTDDRGLLGTDDRGLLGVDFWTGLWTDDRGLLGTDDRGLLGTDDRGLLGTDDRGLLWTDDRGLLGTDDRGLLGTDDRALLGTDDRGLLGTDDRALLGTDDRGLLGTDDRALLGTDVRGLYANSRALGAPMSSEDGGVTIFNRTDALTGDPGTASLEALPKPPSLPAWLTPVGQAYRFVPSQAVSRTIEFAYYQREVPEGYEHTLTIYYSPDEGDTWTRLPTDRDPEENQATAKADESGLYVLTAAVEIAFHTAGWNLFAYPVPMDLPIQEALASIDGNYTTVYGFDSGNPADPWQVYDRRLVPDHAWANDLEKLRFGRGYWINITEPITLALKVGTVVTTTQSQAIALADPVSRRTPPAVYFGELLSNLDAAASARSPMTAIVDGATECGVALVVYDAAGVGRYLIKVDAADAGPLDNCGTPGKQVSLRLGEQVIAENLEWDNDRQEPPAALPTVVLNQPDPQPSSQIRVGERVEVAFQLVNLRRSAGYLDKPGGDVLTIVAADREGVVVEGPVNADDLRWWKVRFGAVEGWMAETNRAGQILLRPSQ